ncbi:MAG: hypothetical protein H7175_05270 [Burkholderiales bacterium]|nr:hypothetical protein [Anaerolineae bacterium]
MAAPSEIVLQQLDAVCDDLRQQGAQLELMRVIAVQTNISLLMGDNAAAHRYLQIAQETAETASVQQPFAAEVIQAPLLKAFVSSAGKRGFAQRELKSLQEAQSKLCHQRPVEERVSHNTYSLHIVTLGQEIMERDGEVIPVSRWRATTARELFLYLLFVGPQSREDFSLAFWPDSSIKHVRSNFHTTLYRARQALGENAIVFQDGVYLINPEIELRCDALKMKQLAAQARVLPSRDARTEDLWQRAVELYRGDFLPSLYADWVLPLREAFHEMYIEALIGLGDCARARGDFRHALANLKQALKADPYREDVHRAIMTCYAQKGEKKQIATHLADLQQLFWKELAIKPSSETMALARSLLS